MRMANWCRLRRTRGGAQLFVHPERAPQWFANLVGPSVGTREVRVMLGDNRMGRILIVGEPRDELGEVWEEVSRRAVSGSPSRR